MLVGVAFFYYLLDVLLFLTGCPELLDILGLSPEETTKPDTARPTYTVIYDANSASSGSVPTDSNSYVIGALVTVLNNTGNLVRTWYSFIGWNTAADGSGTTYSPGTTFTMGSADLTL